MSPPLLLASSLSSEAPSPTTSNDEKTIILDDEKTSRMFVPPASYVSSATEGQFSATIDPEKAMSVVPSLTYTQHNILSGRPDVKAQIQDIVSKADKVDRIAIAACGPDGMMTTVRKTAAACVKINGPSIELYCEQFGW